MTSHPMTRHQTHCLFGFMTALLTAISMLIPTLGQAAEFDIQKIGRSISEDSRPMRGNALVVEELTNLLIGDTTEVGKIVDASKRDFAADGVVYKLRYQRNQEAEIAGTLDYADGAFGRQDGHFLLVADNGQEDAPARLCRAPAMQDVTRRCFHVFEVDENLYEARATSSGLVRYRFRVFNINQILAE